MTTLLNCPFCGNKARIISRAIDRKVALVGIIEKLIGFVPEKKPVR